MFWGQHILISTDPRPKAQRQADSLIPLLTLRVDSVQDAVEISVDIVKSAIRSFDMLSDQLLQRYAADVKLREPLVKLIEAYRYACTGNLDWG
jgi:hypothetical protein